MPEYCKKCEEEVLPYLKTGELKVVETHRERIEDKKNNYVKTKKYLIGYQTWFCLKCKIVYYKENTRREMSKL